MGLRALHFKFKGFTHLVTFERYSQNEVVNVGILVLWIVCEKLSCNTRSEHYSPRVTGSIPVRGNVFAKFVLL